MVRLTRFAFFGVAAMTALSAGAETEAFQRFDLNEDGVLTQNEFGHFHGPAIVEELDLDGSGTVSSLEFERAGPKVSVTTQTPIVCPDGEPDSIEGISIVHLQPMLDNSIQGTIQINRTDVPRADRQEPCGGLSLMEFSETIAPQLAALPE